ncbi:MAG: hypothetical protein D8M59_05440 [Planctomycetes bacterium]|nr:hypothetical protein [Planctomycetota bacterium]
MHSLLGIAPIGVFLFPHLITNSSIVWGRFLSQPHSEYAFGEAQRGVQMFQHEVNFIHALPALPLIEWGALFLPLLFHALIGVYFGLSGKPNVKAYPYGANWRYTLQRLSGYLGVFFIFAHITSLRYGWTYGGLMPAFVGDHAASTTADHFQNGLIGGLMVVVYIVCVSALVYHFANGLWTAAITWGLTVTVEAQKRWGALCALIGIGLGIAGLAAAIGFATLNIEAAESVETAMKATGGHGGGGEAAAIVEQNEMPEH